MKQETYFIAVVVDTPVYVDWIARICFLVSRINGDEKFNRSNAEILMNDAVNVIKDYFSKEKIEIEIFIDDFNEYSFKDIDYNICTIVPAFQQEIE